MSIEWPEGMRPYILVDVDGVINVMASSAERRHKCYHDGWKDVKVPAAGRYFRIFLNPATGRMLRELAAETGAELAWATMWEEHANYQIAPLLGLPELPVAPAQSGKHSVTLLSDAWEGAVYGTKADTVVPWTQGRPFAWFDDDPGEISAMSTRAQGQPHLPVHVDQFTGLTPEYIAFARDWLLDLHARQAALDT